MNFKGFLQCRGKDIIDENGNPYILRGLGIGGWLVKEGYMIQSAASSPSTIEAAWIDLLGKKEAQDFIVKYRDNFCNEKDFKAIAELGFNSVRIPFHYNMLSPKPNVYLEEGFKYLDQIVEWCKKYDMYCILDMHCAPGSQNGQNISDDLSNEAKLYTKNKKYQPHLNDIWRKLAQRYKDEPYIAGYDLINEPVLTHGITMTDLRNSYVSLTNAVREIDKKHIIFIEGDHYSTRFAGLEPKWDDQIVIAFHKYWNPTSVDSIRRYREFQDIMDAPMWLGESGENANQWFVETIDMCESLGISWNWWTHKKMDNITNIYNIRKPKNYELIQDYWFKRGPRPSKKIVKQVFNDWLENIKIENCEFQKDVYYAILKRDELNERIPYNKNLVPCVMDAGNYDLGKVNVSYYKENYMRDNLGKFGWNAGKKHRNDGVDVYEIDNHYAVGFNDKGSYVIYTIEVEEEREYSLSISVKGSGKLQVSIDGENFNLGKEITKFRDILIAKKYLAKGKHEIKITTIKPSYFVKTIEVK